MRQALEPLALRIDHIGSTSVLGLPAKDIIDVQITVAALTDDARAAMNGIGYTQPEGEWRDHCPPNVTEREGDWSKWYFHEPAGQRKTNTHMRVQGRPNQRYALLFRDFLRARADYTAAYAELKRRLAQHLANWKMYPEVKDPAVDLIYFAAEDWAAATHWQPGPSDA